MQPCVLHLRGVADRSLRVSRYGLSVDSMHAEAGGDVSMSKMGWGIEIALSVRTENSKRDQSYKKCAG